MVRYRALANTGNHYHPQNCREWRNQCDWSPETVGTCESGGRGPCHCQSEDTKVGGEQEGYTNLSLHPAFSLLPTTPPEILGDESVCWGAASWGRDKGERMWFLVWLLSCAWTLTDTFQVMCLSRFLPALPGLLTTTSPY